MAEVQIVNENSIRIKVSVEDAVEMVQLASSDIKTYAREIATIFEKMPFFDYTSFCFYAYDTAKLFEKVLKTNPRKYTSFALDAPDGFFYTLYGGMASLASDAKSVLEAEELQAGA